MISPIKIKIEGYGDPESEDIFFPISIKISHFQIKDITPEDYSPIKVNISEYPVFYFFDKKNPINFNVVNSFTLDAKSGLIVKPENNIHSDLFGISAIAICDYIIKGNFEISFFNVQNTLYAKTNYFIKNGFANHSESLTADANLKVVVRAGIINCNITNSSQIVKCYQIKINKLRDWDDKLLEEMDDLPNIDIEKGIIK